MASRLTLARIKEQHAKLEPADRVPQRMRRHRKARDERFRKEAARSRPENGPGSLLGDPVYHMARGAGWDVMRKELRKPDPPTQQRNRGSDTGTLTSYTRPNPYHVPGAKDPMASADCATWQWWKGLTPAQRHAVYELAHEGEPPTGVTVLNMGLEISNPQFLIEVW